MDGWLARDIAALPDDGREGLDVERLAKALAQYRLPTGQYAYLVTIPGWKGGHFASPAEFAAVLTAALAEEPPA